MYPEKISIDIGDISEGIIKDIAYIHSTLTYREIELVNKFRVRLTPWDKHFVRFMSEKGGDKLENDEYISAYDLMIEKVTEGITQVYNGVIDKFDRLFDAYGGRADSLTNQIKKDLEKSMQTSLDKSLKQLDLLVMQQQDTRTFVKKMYDVLTECEKSLNELIYFECLQTVRYMILWSYQDKGYTRYKIFADGENCPHCNEMNRKEFLISSAQPYVNFIPFHPNCNCNAGIIDEKGDVVCWLSNDDISKNKENQKLLGEILTEYLKRTWETFILGDFSDESPTALTTVINILLGIADLDIPMDIRDLAASIIKHDGSFEDWVNLALNTAAFIPMIGSVKYTDEVLDALKPAAKNSDAIADGVKGVIKSDIADNVNDIGKAAVKNSDEIKEEIIKIVNGYEIKINVGQQNKHILGTNEYKTALNSNQNRSIIYGDLNDIQKLIDDKAGTGEFIGNKNNKERVDFMQVIGQYIDPNTGIGVETTVGIIHYGKNGVHIVPAKPKLGR